MTTPVTKHYAEVYQVGREGDSYCKCSCGEEFVRHYGGAFAAMEDYLLHKEVLVVE